MGIISVLAIYQSVIEMGKEKGKGKENGGMGKSLVGKERRGGRKAYFIPTKTIKIHPQLLDIHLPMRRIRHPIYT